MNKEIIGLPEQKVGLAENPKTSLAEQGQACGCLGCTNGLSTGMMSCPQHWLNYSGEVITIPDWARQTSTRAIWNSHINNGNPIGCKQDFHTVHETPMESHTSRGTPTTYLGDSPIGNGSHMTLMWGSHTHNENPRGCQWESHSTITGFPQCIKGLP